MEIVFAAVGVFLLASCLLAVVLGRAAAYGDRMAQRSLGDDGDWLIVEFDDIDWSEWKREDAA